MVPRIKLKFKNPPHKPAEYSFSDRRVCLIGRGLDCDLQLPSEEDYLVVSRHHCRLEIDPPYVRVRDLGSRNGTRINGMQIGHPDNWRTPRPKVLLEYELHDGDELTVGPAVIEVRAPRPEDSPVHMVDMPETPAADRSEAETREPGSA
jgi:pSer/pThr/pTyr-binding forkhead associated (FHA) protein